MHREEAFNDADDLDPCLLSRTFVPRSPEFLHKDSPLPSCQKAGKLGVLGQVTRTHELATLHMIVRSCVTKFNFQDSTLYVQRPLGQNPVTGVDFSKGRLLATISFGYGQFECVKSMFG